MPASGHDRAVTAVGIFLLTVSALPAAAQSPGVADVANYTGLDRQVLLESGARREGELRLYTTGTRTEPILTRFGEKYPFVRLQVFRGSAAAWVRKAAEEYRTGRPAVDAVAGSSTGLRRLLAEGILQPYRFPDMAVYPAEAVEPGRHWVVDSGSYLNFAYNPKTAPEAAAIGTYDDLLDPRWKGRLTLSGWVSSTAFWVGALVLTRGEDFVRRLGRQEFVTYRMSPQAVANLIVAGEVPLSPAIDSSHVAAYKAKGASIEWRALGPSWVDVDGVALARGAPHPHAAMLLIDFMLSREGQKMRQDIGNVTARVDMENSVRPSRVLYLTERPDFAREFQAWSDLTTEVFGPGRNHPKGGEPAAE